MIVAIDGPSGAGKSTLAKHIAKELRFTYLDTGAIYRALALKILRRGVDLDDTAALNAIVNDSDIDLRGRNGQLQVFLDGEDVSAAIRTPEVSQMASKASAIAMVRRRLLDLQRALGRRDNVVAEGRDIGTVVFPTAELKIYLTASEKVRGERRFNEMKNKGIEITESQVLNNLTGRDLMDSTRKTGPLKKADDAYDIDNSSMSESEQFELVLKLAQEKIAAK